MKNINLIFHDIKSSKEQVSNIYDVSEKFLFDLVQKLVSTIDFSHFRIRLFFDDGYKSHLVIASKLLERFPQISLYFGISVKLLGTENYLTIDEFFQLSHLNIEILSHCYSHTALGLYEGKTVLKTPLGGQYEDSDNGWKRLLSKNEVLFQIIESHNWFLNNGVPVDGLVYPFGVFNQQIIELLRSSNYQKAYTCEFGLESDTDEPYAIPRMLITSDQTVDFWFERVMDLCNT